MADPGKPRPHLGEQRRRTVAILDVSLVDHGTEQPPASVHHDMALAAHHLLTRVKPARTSAFRGLHRLAVDHPGSRGSGPPLGLAGARQKRPVDLLPRPVVAPLVEIVLNRAARRKLAGQRPFFGVVEVDESFFGARRIKGKRGRGAYGKTVVFGIFEREGQVYTEIVPDCSKSTLQGIIRGRVDPSTVVNSDGWRGYNGLVDLGYGHFRVDHSCDEFARGPVHINGIEGFWGMAKVRLVKFMGVPRHTFHLHLKETEWRFNHRASNKVRLLLRQPREKPIC